VGIKKMFPLYIIVISLARGRRRASVQKACKIEGAFVNREQKLWG